MLRFATVLAVIASPALSQQASVAGTDGQSALGTVPCAGRAGDPLQSCNAELRRRDDGTATLAVMLPGGDVRRIYFTDGIPDSSSSPSPINHEVRGDIMVIFIEPGEVYELPKAALNTQ